MNAVIVEKSSGCLIASRDVHSLSYQIAAVEPDVLAVRPGRISRYEIGQIPEEPPPDPKLAPVFTL